ncbi:RNA-directed DNA polymerase, eukaryota, reverse transcriptase zinc-binding domain protein, partial [Tanacetum coccineum]
MFLVPDQLVQELEKLESIELAQKAKLKWALEGDENSKYYHGVINKKRSNLAIRGVLIDGNWVESPTDVKKAFFDHFKNRFEKPVSFDISFDKGFVTNITADQAEDLEKMVSKEEIKSAVWDCGVDKSPGPDGFTFGFYRRYWHLIEQDVVNAVSWFFSHNRIPNGGNSSFITLIPKTSNANLMKDFRPISLIGSLYKIIAKILANRLVLVLEDLVSDSQSAFVKDRQILDGPFILNELVQWCKKKRKKSMFFKVDFEKAFDSVRWDFIINILKKFGFGNRWCTWISNCLRSSRGSLLVNGSPTSEFQFFKGLKQGDPISPFLFILVMESLHISFQRVVDAGLFTGIKLNEETSISHLFYADDAIFMGQWCHKNIDVLKHVLDVFYRASGLHINVHKSKLMGITVDNSNIEQAVEKIGCMSLKMPFTYLGSKVGALMSRTIAWKEVIESLEARLSRWKIKTLSIGGRLTLLKAVLGSIPIFYMSLFKVPKSVLQYLEGLRAKFFNGVDDNSKKPSWVSWNKVMAAKDSGGLGVASFFALNRALMCKWIWRFISQKNSLWARVISAIHGSDGKIGHNITQNYPSIWLCIVQEIEKLKVRGIDILSFIKPICGDGSNTSFWSDAWRGAGKLKDLAPRLFLLEQFKDITVANKMSHENIDWSFRRHIRSGIESHQMSLLKERLNGCSLSNSKDRWSWSLEGSGEFSVTSIRRLIDAAYLPSSNVKTRWIREVPIKINILAWKVINDYLPSRFNMSRRGIEVNSISCPLCNHMVETSRHLFFSCDFSAQIMSKIRRWWDLEYNVVDSVDSWI